MGFPQIEVTTMKPSLTLAIALALSPLLATAQTPIYESRDKAGPVFSDTQTPGSTPVELSPINVIQTPKVAPSQSSAQPAAAGPASYGRPRAIVRVLGPGVGRPSSAEGGRREAKSAVPPR